MNGARLVVLCVVVFIGTAAIGGGVMRVVGLVAGVVGLFVGVPWAVVDLARRARSRRGGEDTPDDCLTTNP